MTDKQAKQEGYTHKAQRYGVSGYARFDDESLEFRGKYLLTDLIYECILYVDAIVGFNEYGFATKIGKSL